MTHNIIKSLTALMMGAMLLTGCGKDNKDNKDIEPFGVTDVHTTGCLQSKLLEDEEAWQVYWDQGKLRVHHLGWMVPCDWHNVTVSIESNGSVVTINECGEGGEVDCLCDKHNLFVITGLDHGTYTFVFKECGEERHRQEYTI